MLPKPVRSRFLNQLSGPEVLKKVPEVLKNFLEFP
jgi:hypothetical protein